MKAKENKATAQATTNKTESTKRKEENTMNKTTKTTLQEKKRYYLCEMLDMFNMDECYFDTIEQAKEKIEEYKTEIEKDTELYERMLEHSKKYHSDDYIINIDDTMIKTAEHWCIVDLENKGNETENYEKNIEIGIGSPYFITENIVYHIWLNIVCTKNKDVFILDSTKQLFFKRTDKEHIEQYKETERELLKEFFIDIRKILLKQEYKNPNETCILFENVNKLEKILVPLTANEQRLAKAKERNEQRLATTKEQIEQATANSENIVNQKAVELSQILKTTKDKNNKQATDTMYTIASILSHSKLNKLNAKETTYNATNVELKNDIAKAIDRNGNGTKYETTLEQLNKLYVVKYNKDGEKIIECTDKRQAQEIEKRLVALANNDGMDIIQDAVLKLWYYISKAIEKYGIENLTDTILLDTFEKAIPHSKVYRNGEQKPVELWQYRTTNAIKETSIEISRSIEKLRSVKDTEKAYIPIETLIENENGEQETITQYKQASILSVVPTCDINGKIITETANETTEHLIENVLEKANFTRNESYIFKWYFVGNKTKEQILEKLNVSERYFKQTVAKIRSKCAVVLCENTKYTIQDATRTNNEKQKIVCYLANNENEQEIATFESIGKASEFLNIDKSNISKVLKGKLKQTNGYTFKYAE